MTLKARKILAPAVLAAAVLPGQVAVLAQIAPAPTPLPSSRPREANRDEYRAHLKALTTLVAACAQARDSKACNPAEVGPDDRVPLTSASASDRRLVRYGWLRVLLSRAQDKDTPQASPRASHRTKETTWEDVRPVPRTTSQLLQDAQTRLTHDLTLAGAAAPIPPPHTAERAVMDQVLAQRDFEDLEAPNPKDSTFEKVGNWLNRVLEGAMRASARAPWLGRALVWGFILALCVALIWGLLRLERRWRVRLIPEDRSPSPAAASAVPWQQWMENALRAAQSGKWREAIHSLYWASISRLESKRFWPADRARTPREYLALIANDDPRLAGLATLTRSFERTWYGARPASESDFLRAEHIATALISGTSPSDHPTSGGAKS